MNDIERRTLIGAAGLGAIAALSKAGPLNPPAGSVTPTGRTLDEVYNRIPSGSTLGAYEGRTPIPGGAGSTTLGISGSYILTGNINAVGGNGITIVADNVTLDLNGFTIASSASTGGGVVVSGPARGVVVRNGSISGFANGVSIPDAAANIQFEDLFIKRAKQYGIYLADGGSRAVCIRRCTIQDTGATTTAADGSMPIVGISAAGNAHTIDACTVQRLFYNGGGTPAFTGIDCVGGTGGTLYLGRIISRCTVTHDAAISGLGIHLSNGGIYRENSVNLFASAYSVSLSAVDGGGNA